MVILSLLSSEIDEESIASVSLEGMEDDEKASLVSLVIELESVEVES